MQEIINNNKAFHNITNKQSSHWQAPEIFKVKYRFYDRKVDLWSLGVILYQGVVGVLPFKVRNMRRFEDMERLMSTPVNAV